MTEWSVSLGSSSGARISKCGRYRTLLWRTFAIEGNCAPLVFVMLNPSTADARQDDPTIRRCLGFAKREGSGGIIVVNLSPWRATDPRELNQAFKRGNDVLWSLANADAMRLARAFGSFVFAWGSRVFPWMDNAARMARQIGGHGMCLGRTKNGEPRHPLMVAKTQPLIAYI